MSYELSSNNEDQTDMMEFYKEHDQRATTDLEQDLEKAIIQLQMNFLEQRV